VALEQIRKGSTRTVLLRLLQEEPKYGYQIVQELEERNDGYFEMQEGLLYPALHQMERDGLLTSEWRDANGKRRRKYYLITDQGRKALAASVREWRAFTEQLERFLGGQDACGEAVSG
jgi:PadR family transcriptional regulator PadR